MTSYLRPGVFVEESLNSLTDVVTSDPSEAVAAFVGPTPAGGPAGPTLVTSWNQFRTLFGGLSTGVGEDLAYAVYSFFNNGGTAAYIVRALNANATPAALTLTDGGGTPTNVLTVTASAPGTWASAADSSSRVFVSTQPATGGRFDLIVEVGTAGYLASREQFVDLSMNPSDARYVGDYVNSPVVGSKYVSVAPASGYTYNATTPVGPALATKVPLTGGTEGTGTPDVVLTTQRLSSLDRNLVVNVPGASAADVSAVVSWASAAGRHFVVADVPKPVSGETAEASVTAMTTFAAALPSNSVVGVYGPWTYMADPNSRSGALRLTAPGGAVVGHFLRTDATRGVHKAPAGSSSIVQGALSPYADFTNAQQDTLYSASVNLLKVLPGSGVVIWGSRTKGQGFPDRYVPIRRTLISLKSGLTARTRFAIFEPNDADLWSLLEDAVRTYLVGLFNVGTFKGANQSEAFFVRCDETNNSPTDVDAGVINIDVGVALKSPAEFIIIRLGQTQSGATATDSLERE